MIRAWFGGANSFLDRAGPAYNRFMLIDVHPAGPGATRGWCEWPDNRVRCVLGRGGVRRHKREGDGVTPAGVWPLRHILFRGDLFSPGALRVPSRAIRRDDGWSDDARDPRYNRPIRLPSPYGHERLWRGDRLYDLVLVLGYNDAPPVRGLGSAIFFHRARENFSPTEGCVALALPDLVRLVQALDASTAIRILEP